MVVPCTEAVGGATVLVCTGPGGTVGMLRCVVVVEVVSMGVVPLVVSPVVVGVVA